VSRQIIIDNEKNHLALYEGAASEAAAGGSRPVLDLRQIQYFVCRYEEGSVTRAARRLNVVQPALSMQIGRLEKRLGVDLFERTARGMVPTSAGEAMYRLYLPVLLDLKHANQMMMELSGKVLGKIAVGIIPSITNSVLADVLRRSAKNFRTSRSGSMKPTAAP
jgi:LysR family transcriptional regulator, nitrogen assimilation regulatory protein